MNLKNKKALDKAGMNLMSKLKEGVTQYNYKIPTGKKGQTGSRNGGSMYDNVNRGASSYENPTSLINSNDPFNLKGDSDNYLKAVDDIEIGKSFKAPQEKKNQINSQAAEGGKTFVKEDKSSSSSTKAINSITTNQGGNPNSNTGRVLQGVYAQEGGRLADGYLDLGNGFKQAQAIVRNVKAKQDSKSDPTSANYKPAKHARKTNRFLRQGERANKKLGTKDFYERSDLSSLKINTTGTESRGGLKPMVPGYMSRSKSSQQETQDVKTKNLMTNLDNTNIGRPKNNTGSTSGDTALNIGKLNNSPGGVFSPLSQSQINTDKKVNRINKINKQIQTAKTNSENIKANKIANLSPGLGQRIGRGKTMNAVKKDKISPSPFNGMLPGSSEKITSKNNPKFTVQRPISDPNRITSGSISPSNPVNIKSSNSAATAQPGKKQKNKIGANPSGSRDKASAANPKSVSKQSRKNYLTSGINPNKKETVVKNKTNVKTNKAPVNNKKNTKKVKSRKVNPTVNNKFDMGDELASVSSKKGL